MSCIPDILCVAEGALRASATASPPYNMHTALVLHGVIVVVVGSSVVFVRAKQVRREMDERMAQQLDSDRHMEGVPMDTLGTNFSGQSIQSIDKEENGWIQDGNTSIPLPDKRDDTRAEVVGIVAR